MAERTEVRERLAGVSTVSRRVAVSGDAAVHPVGVSGLFASAMRKLADPAEDVAVQAFNHDFKRLTVGAAGHLAHAALSPGQYWRGQANTYPAGPSVEAKAQERAFDRPVHRAFRLVDFSAAFDLR